MKLKRPLPGCPLYPQKRTSVVNGAF
jgi:hypothetical protein